MRNLLEFSGIREPSEILYLDFVLSRIHYQSWVGFYFAIF